MPGLGVHTYVDRLLFGRSYWRVHRAMDRPYKYLGRHHRVLFHDPLLAFMIARKEYPNDSNAVAAAQCHIALDNICTRNPALKKKLTQLAKLSLKKRKRGQTAPERGLKVSPNEFNIWNLRQLVDLFNSAMLGPVDPALMGLLYKRLQPSIRGF